MSAKKCHAKLNVSGVDIYGGGEQLAGITEREAVELHRSLTRLLPKIKATIKRYKL